ncbi:MAG: hypothetical protein J5705_01645 [Bacteroidaceae bacterium]|nr:hypothetical protein [Bacteroidaceae bacterium]
MKKITKIITATTIAAFTCGFFALNSSNDVMLGNIEALTDGDCNVTIEDTPCAVRTTWGEQANIVKEYTGWCGWYDRTQIPDYDVPTCKEIVVRPN